MRRFLAGGLCHIVALVPPRVGVERGGVIPVTLMVACNYEYLTNGPSREKVFFKKRWDREQKSL